MSKHIRMNVDDLEEDELNYELLLRDMTISGQTETKKRSLRAIMRQEAEKGINIETSLTFDTEFETIKSKVDEIDTILQQEKNPACESRLYHYLKRLKRIKVSDEVDTKSKSILLDFIRELLEKYFKKQIDISDERVEEGAIGGVTVENSINSNESRLDKPGTTTQNPNADTGTRPKQPRIIRADKLPTVEPSKHSQSGIQNSRRLTKNQLDQNFNPLEYVHVTEIEEYVKRCIENINQSRSTNILDTNQLAEQLLNFGIHDSEADRIFQSSFEHREAARQTRSVIPNNLNVPDSVRKNLWAQTNDYNQRRLSQLERLQTIRQPRNPFELEEYQNDTLRQNQLPRLTHFSSVPNINRSTAIPNLSVPISPTRTQSRSNENIPQRLPHQTCNIIEKWPKFQGDNNPVPLVSFLRNIDILCRSYGIAKSELIRHAHLLFQGDAAIWYTTYVEKLTDWEALVYYLTLRYDNPNRDRFIKEEMRNRKQRQNELFSAFLTDIESLAQRLICKMSESEKFEIITDNMKMSYKRRLALHEIYSIEELANMCYRFDALENSLYTPKTKTYEIHNIEEDEESEIEEINAIERNAKEKYRNTDKQNKIERPERNTEIICWNCQGTDHFWKDCAERKTIFCHVCGTVGKFTSNCPNNHPPFENRLGNQKNRRRDGV